MQTIEIAVIIVNYHSQALVCRCLDSLKRHSVHRLYCLVVDNSETPDVDLIAAHHPEAEIILAGRNLGFAGGCNVGIAKALARHSKYLLLLNPDAWVESDSLSPLIAALEESPVVGMAGPRILYGDGSRRLWNGGGRLNWWAGGTRTLLGQEPNEGEKRSIDFLSGCAMLLKAEAVRQVGPLGEEYFLYFEDTDYVQRFIKAGWSVAYVPTAEVLHDPSAVTGQQSACYVYYFSRNRILFMRRWGKWHHFLVFMLYNTLVKLPGAVLVFGVKRRQPELVLAYFKGYWDGLRGYRISAK